MKLKDILNEITGIRVKIKDLTFDKLKDIFKDRYQNPSEFDPEWYAHMLKRYPNFKNSYAAHKETMYHGKDDFVYLPSGNGEEYGIGRQGLFDEWKEEMLRKGWGDAEMAFDPSQRSGYAKIEDEEYKRKEAEKTQSMSKWYDQLKYKGD